MKTRYIAIPIVMVAILALAAFSMPVGASGDPGAGCPSETKYHGTINGNVYLGFDYDTNPGQPKQPKTEIFTDVPDGIKLAKVYTGFWQGSPGKGEKFNITIVNDTGGSYTTIDYQFCDPCPVAPCAAYQDLRCDALNWSGNTPPNPDPRPDDIYGYDVGCGVQFVSFNATPYITPGTNTITATPSDSGNCFYLDGRVYIIALLVVYENASMPEITYWINEGAPYIEVGSACDGPDDHTTASFYFNGTSMIDNPTTVRYDVLGWPHVINASDPGVSSTTLNGCNIGVPDFHTANPPYNKYYDYYLRYDNIYDDCPNCLNPSGTGNLMSYVDNAAWFERAFVAWLVAKGPGKDLIVSNIEFPPAMRPGKDHTINATIKNQGSTVTGSFNVSLLVDGVPNGTVSVPGGLGGGDDTTVSFPVNLPYGCYNFTVVADCDGDVSESNEENNELSLDRQVGYYIVVDGNSGFDALLDEVAGGWLPPNSVVDVSGTYYIQNMDIENCHGAGIQIENTNVPFVITNCTVHDCAGEGAVFLGNLVNGKVNDSTIKDNTMKGIRLRNCSYVDIDNNLVQNNAKYGIDVYLTTMPQTDCEFIDITRNTLIGNEYGIELIGDNCIARDNIIRNSNSYGMYVFGNGSKIYNNTIDNSVHYGIKMDHAPVHPCNGNCIYGNALIDNNGGGVQGYDSGDNYWNSTVELGYYNSTGTPFDNYIGNNWSDYKDRYPGAGEVDGSEIWDTPYEIDGGTMKDYAPLMQPWTDYGRIECGDVDASGGLPSGGDVGLLRQKVYHDVALDSEWAGDVDCSGGLPSGGDIGLLRQKVYHGATLDCCKGCE